MFRRHRREFAQRAPHKRAEFIIDTTRGKDMKRGFTLIITFSRAWCIQNFFAAFNHLKIDMKRCHLLVIDNSDLTTVRDGLAEKLDVYKDFFYTTRLYKTWRKGGGELVTMDNAAWDVGKLPYIYEMHLDMMRLCTTDKFVLLEDDTLPPYKTHPDTVMRLLSHLDKHPRCGIATAIETGRSSVPYAKTRLGVHYIEREGNKITARITPSPHLRGLHHVDACGWYCCASYKKLWLAGFEGMDEYVAGVPRFAMDNIQTNNIKLLGYDIIADFGMWCVHMNHTSDSILFWGKKQAVPMLDVWLPQWSEYAQGVALSRPEHKKILRRIKCQRQRTALRG